MPRHIQRILHPRHRHTLQHIRRDGTRAQNPQIQLHIQQLTRYIRIPQIRKGELPGLPLLHRLPQHRCHHPGMNTITAAQHIAVHGSRGAALEVIQRTERCIHNLQQLLSRRGQRQHASLPPRERDTEELFQLLELAGILALARGIPARRRRNAPRLRHLLQGVKPVQR